ncbi:unnamed protein product, partial [Mesorhabditis spiculigera]
MVKQQLALTQNDDESLGYSAFMMANPPMRNVMKFIFFNITNEEEVKYNGAQPRVFETGAYSVLESEQKRYIEFSSDQSQMFYENYKIYNIDPEESCETCDWEEDIVTIPNPVEVGAAADVMDPQFGISDPEKHLIAVMMLLVGEYPFITKKVKEILFTGYNDPMLSLAHSDLVATISKIVKGDNGSIIPIPCPAMPRLGFFIGYNNSQDESYWVKTGKNNIEDIGKVTQWGNVRELPDYWWTDDYARSIRGSDSGSFNKWKLEKSDRLEMFYSFMCRSFNKEFLEETEVNGIPAYRYSTPFEDYDSTLEINRGFRYRNFENIDYFPNWPECPEKNASRCSGQHSVDCSQAINFCNDCCNGSHVGDTYLLPPGIFPLVCYPGKLQPTPFSVMYSPPHFLYSPQQVIDTVVGMNPDPELHRPFLYDHEPHSGQAMRVQVRLMVSTPMMNRTTFFHNTHLPCVMFPIFYQSAKAVVLDVVLNKLWLGFVFVPKAVAFLKYLLISFGLFLLVLLFLIRNRQMDHKPRHKVLNEHNKYRNRHQVGSLVLDEKLNNLAQEWANRLASTGSFQHRPNSGYGENISMGSGSYANDLVKPWYDEVQNYNFGRHAGSGTGHFTQIVWKASKKLGVGRAVAKDGSTYLVCNYEPAGNLIGAHAQNVFPAK